jgi:hypothetical protein
MLNNLKRSISQGIDVKSKTCRSQRPPYCAYHGVPAPKNISNIQKRIHVAETETNTAKRNFDIEKVNELTVAKKNLETKLQAINIVAGKTKINKKILLLNLPQQ